MYLRLAIEQLSSGGERLWRHAVLRSGVVTIAAVALVLLGLALGWRAHTRGSFHQMKASLRHSDVPHTAPSSSAWEEKMPWLLERSAIEGGATPEFLSATLLPGRGMNVLQITATSSRERYCQSAGLASLEQAANRMNGVGADSNGAEGLAIGGAIEAPWAGDIFGTPLNGALNTMWHGIPLRLPANRRNEVSVATGGLLLARQGVQAKTSVMPDGGEAEAVYEAGNFDGSWPSEMRVKSTVQLSSRAIEMRIVATNTGKDPQPVGLGWRPRFAVLSGDAGDDDTAAAQHHERRGSSGDGHADWAPELDRGVPPTISAPERELLERPRPE